MFRLSQDSEFLIRDKSMNTMITNAAPNLRLVESDGTARSVASTSVNSMPEHEMRLMEKLQTTLDIEQLINYFSAESSQVIHFDGIEYVQKSQEIALTIGKKTTHRCSYGLKIEGNLLGDMIFYRRKRFQENELHKIEILLSSLIFPLKNALLYKQALESAFTDPLTGAQNRAAMNQALDREIKLARRQNNPLSIILLDADHFKKINDTYGHSHGDEVLKAIAKVSRETIRQSDVLYRYGGEEFLILLGQTDTDGAIHLADRIRENIAALDMINGTAADITASLGVTTLSEHDTHETLFNRADKALYQAKDAGRNRTVTMIES